MAPMLEIIHINHTSLFLLPVGHIQWRLIYWNRRDWYLRSSCSWAGFISAFHIGPQSSLRWRHNGRDCVSNHQPHECLLNRIFRRRSQITSKLRVTGLCAGNSPGTGEFSAQMASNAENVSIWWRHHVVIFFIHCWQITHVAQISPCFLYFYTLLMNLAQHVFFDCEICN